jgi:hypothetical protein
MKLFKIVRGCGIFAGALCMSQLAHAVSGVTITGELVSKMPAVTLPALDNAIANVKSVNFRASQGADAGCALTTSEVTAKNHIQKNGDLVCFFEWILPAGLSQYADGVNGYFKNSGNQDIGYRVSIFSGSSNEKLIVETGSMSVVVANAVLPLINGYTTTVTSGSKVGNNVTSNNKGDILKTIKIDAEARPFNQLFSIKNVGNCEIPEGSTACTINSSNTPISKSEAQVGVTTYEVIADSLNGYFASENRAFKDLYNLSWDYRTPMVDDYAMQAVSPGNEKTITKEVNGQTLIINNEKALLIVSSPHFGQDGTWWHPIANLKLKPDPQYTPRMPKFELGGGDMLHIGDMISLPTGDMQLNPVNTSQIGDKFIFEYQLSSVPDGVYFPVVNVKDAYGNQWEDKVSTSTPLDRKPPEIRIFTKAGRALAKSDPVYFFDELMVAAVDSMSGAGKVLSATVDGSSVLGDNVNEQYDYLKRLRAADNQLEPNKEVMLSLVVEDNAGNKATAEIPVRYMPVAWELDDRKANYKKSVQRINFPLRQTLGPGCRIFESLTAARNANSNFGYRCGVEWVNTPSGTSGGWERRLQYLMGNFSNINQVEDTNKAFYNVWMFNSDGVEALAYRGEQSFNVTSAEKPLISVNDYRQFQPGIFQTSVDGGYITSTSVEFDNGDLRYEIDTGLDKTLYEYIQTGFAAKRSRMSRTLAVEPAPLWTDRQINLTASYIGDPTVNSVNSFRVIHTPSLAITAYLESGKVVQTNENLVGAVLHLGVKNLRTREIEYNKEVMGEWTVRLATEKRNRDGTYEYHHLTDPLPVNDEGKAEFDIDLTPYEMGGHRFITLVSVKSPIAEYTRTIKSNAVFFQVYKGQGIDGKTKIRRIAGRVPFPAQMLFVPEAHEDRVAKGNVDWEMSTDEGKTWTVIAQSRDYVSKMLTVEGLYQFRAKVTNKYTDEQVYTEHQEVLAYSIPSLKLDGSMALHPNETATISLFDHDEPADSNNAEIQWSLDNGETWSEGLNTIDITMKDEIIRLQARMAYEGTELAESKRWSYVKHNIRKARPLPVRIIYSQPRMMEKGVTYQLDPKVVLVDRGTPTKILGKWKLPNGEFVEGLNIEYQATEDDVSNKSGLFEFHAWAEGYYSETLSVKKFTVKIWEYQFPSFEISGGARTTYAPASGAIIIPTPSDMPPAQAGVIFETLWTTPSEFEVIRQTDKQVIFNITTAGQHQVKALISDNRGNSKSVMMYISVTEAPEPEMTIEPRFSNQVMREPLTVTARLNGRLGHPLDRISRIEWLVDGQLQEQIGGTIMVQGLNAGNHNITAKMETTYGVKREYTFPISVVMNIAPTCSVEEKDYSSIIRLDMKCSDADGKIARYQWELNGDILPYTGSYINVSKTSGNISRIVVNGVDDSGALSNTIEKNFNY